jgi:hypothetical protein
MELLRGSSYPLLTTFKAESPDSEYAVTVVDTVDRSYSIQSVTSTEDSDILVELPSDYDGEYEVIFGDEREYVSVVRPYFATDAETASQKREKQRYEELSRAIIDSVVSQGFYFKKKILQVQGLGSDYVPIWDDVTKILRVYENNVLVYDHSTPNDFESHFELSPDRTAIVRSYSGLVNRREFAPLIFPASSSDTNDYSYSQKGFPRGHDYSFVVSVGYKRLPSDISRAAQILAEDIECGRLEYFQRYISNYDTEQFMVKLDRVAFEGTGNLIVDKILSKYKREIKTVGVL